MSLETTSTGINVCSNRVVRPTPSKGLAAMRSAVRVLVKNVPIMR